MHEKAGESSIHFDLDEDNQKPKN